MFLVNKIVTEKIITNWNAMEYLIHFNSRSGNGDYFTKMIIKKREDRLFFFGWG
jgi:hypothetical protein